MQNFQQSSVSLSKIQLHNFLYKLHDSHIGKAQNRISRFI